METPKKRGKLELIIGPMFAGKTSELMRRMRRFHLCKLKCLLIKYAKDTRYSTDKIVSHDGKEMPATGTLNLEYLKDEALKCDIIGIDEAQFFTDLNPFCRLQLENGKIIVVAGLDSTFMRTGFDNVLSLIPLAHSVDKLTAICMSCGDSASFSKRVGTETEIVVIGGLDKYMAVCRTCHDLDYPPTNSPFKELLKRDYAQLPESDLKQC